MKRALCIGVSVLSIFILVSSVTVTSGGLLADGIDQFLIERQNQQGSRLLGSVQYAILRERLRADIGNETFDKIHIEIAQRFAEEFEPCLDYCITDFYNNETYTNNAYLDEWFWKMVEFTTILATTMVAMSGNNGSGSSRIGMILGLSLISSFCISCCTSVTKSLKSGYTTIYSLMGTNAQHFLNEHGLLAVVIFTILGAPILLSALASGIPLYILTGTIDYILCLTQYTR